MKEWRAAFLLPGLGDVGWALLPVSTDGPALANIEQGTGKSAHPTALITHLTRTVMAAVPELHYSNQPMTSCSPTPCGSVDSRISSNPPGHKGLGYSDSELLLGIPTALDDIAAGLLRTPVSPCD